MTKSHQELTGQDHSAASVNRSFDLRSFLFGLGSAPGFRHSPLLPGNLPLSLGACLKILRGAVFVPRVGWRGATKEHGCQRPVTEEQRSPTALGAKTLRAAGLLPVGGVGATLTARCGDAPLASPARTSPPCPQPKSRAAAPIAIFRQALSLYALSFETTSGFKTFVPWRLGGSSASFPFVSIRGSTCPAFRLSVFRSLRLVPWRLGGSGLRANPVQFFVQDFRARRCAPLPGLARVCAIPASRSRPLSPCSKNLCYQSVMKMRTCIHDVAASVVRADRFSLFGSLTSCLVQSSDSTESALRVSAPPPLH